MRNNDRATMQRSLGAGFDEIVYCGGVKPGNFL
jgi:hypothetical protein